MLSLSRFFKHKKAQKRIKQAIENYQPKQDRPVAYFLAPEMKRILKPIQFSDVKELVIKTDYRRKTYKNLKEITILIFEDDIHAQ